MRTLLNWGLVIALVAGGPALADQPQDHGSARESASKTWVAPQPGPAVRGRGLPGKQDRLENWRSLPALEAYQLFKQSGRELPRELLLQFCESDVVTPWTPELRQAGGSPGSARLIANTAPGDSFSDQGNTTLLANYLHTVPFVHFDDCSRSAPFDGNDAWYTFTLTQPTLVSASTCGPVHHFDTLVGFFNTNLDQVAGGDDGCGPNMLQTTFGCCLDPGTYYVVVDGFAGESGAYELTVDFAACPTPAEPTRGGPDAFGHTWGNTADPDGPDNNWYPIELFGFPVILGDDDYTDTLIPLGFDFPYFGSTRSQLCIGSNGVVGFQQAGMDYPYGTMLPNAIPGWPRDLIAPLWCDLDPAAGGSIHYLSEPHNGRFIVQFTDVPSIGSSATNTFQVILDKSGDILFIYGNIDETAAELATVGLQNATGSDGLTVHYNSTGGAIIDHSAVRVVQPRVVQGGPDAFGYTWQSSEAPGGPQSEWLETSFGTTVVFSNQDDAAATVPLPFPFPFYGTTYSQVQVTTNGWLSFNGVVGFPAFDNTALPNPLVPNNAIHVLWDDLFMAAGGEVTYYNDVQANRFILQWTNQLQVGTNSGYLKFQAILHPNGEIELQYRDVVESLLSSCSIGLENSDGSVGLQVRHNDLGATLHDNLAIRFTPPPTSPRPTRGGPDAGGYAWVNSLDPIGPPNLWEDISYESTTLALSQDDEQVAVSLPFAFPFYGAQYTQMQVCSNGWIGFGSSAPLGDPAPIPTAGGVDNAIFAFWDDLFLPAGGSVYYLDDSVHGRVIVQWQSVPHANGIDGPYTFQAQLYQGGEIYLCYQVMGGAAAVAHASVGTESVGGVAGLQVNHDDVGGWLAPGVTVLLHPTQAPPARITDLRITPVDFSPGNATVQFSYTPVTTDVLGNPLVVDHYLLVATTGNGYDFNNVNVDIEQLPPEYVGGGLLFFGNLGWTSSAYFHLVAVDAAGVLLGGDTNLPWRTEDEIPGRRGSGLLFNRTTAGAIFHRP